MAAHRCLDENGIARAFREKTRSASRAEHCGPVSSLRRTRALRRPSRLSVRPCLLTYVRTYVRLFVRRAIREYKLQGVFHRRIPGDDWH